jgi:putative ABC transport system substrate-binding protein
MPVVGFLGAASPDLTTVRLRAFHEGLSEMGYVEGRNVVLEYRWAENQPKRIPELIADLVRRPLSALVTIAGTPSVLAAKSATTTIPIVFVAGTDPVQAGLIVSFSRPGGNLTGVSSLALRLAPKRLELLHELLPAAKAFAFVVNPASALAEAATTDARNAAQAQGLTLYVLQARTERDFDTVFANARQLRAHGLVIDPDQLFVNHNEQLAQLALHHAMPTVFVYRDFVAAGGLMSYGGSMKELYGLLGVYTGRILKGDKPADLPVQQPKQVELFINLNTARALGLDVPATVLARADEVIE